jgi:signal transduction histidine kinase
MERRRHEFINMASHELKTPPTSSKGFTQILHHRLYKQGDEQLLPKTCVRAVLSSDRPIRINLSWAGVGIYFQ